VKAYTKTEVNLGGAVALAAGTMSLTTNMRSVEPIWVYTKSRDLCGGLMVDGTVIKERPETNADVYGPRIAIN
jgi:lipid-binding SYLF domain-containing protein